MAEKELQNDLQFEELRFLQFLATQKILFEHKLQFQMLERHLLKQQIQMDESHKLQFANLRQINQIKSDFQLLVQESAREFLQQQQQLQITHLQHTHVTAQDQLQLVLKVSREQQKKQMDQEMKQQIKDFRGKLKTQQMDQQKEEKEYKRQLTQEALSKKEVEKLQKGKKEALKEKLAQKEKEFETTLLKQRGLEEKQLLEVQERQYKALINAQERERRNMDMEHIEQEKKTQHEQHEEQLKLLKELHGKLLILNRQHCIDEEDFQRQIESQTLNLLQEHHKQQIQTLRQQHEQQKQMWNGFKRSHQELEDRQKAEMNTLLKSQQDENTKHQEKLSARLEQVQKGQAQRLKTLDKEIADEEHGLLQLHKQQKEAKHRHLASKHKQLSSSYMINSVDSEGQTKLHVAAALGDVAKASQLVKDGIAIDVQDKNGWTALHCAAYSRHKNVFQLLLQQDKIDVSLKNESGSTALHYFCRNFYSSVYNEEQEGLIAKLIKKGANVNVKNLNGETPLHYACWNNNMSIVKALLDKGADINAVTDLGETCLHWALRTPDCTDLVNYLLKRGVDVNIKGKNGTALDVVTETGHNPALYPVIAERMTNKPGNSPYARVGSGSANPPPLPPRNGSGANLMSSSKSGSGEKVPQKQEKRGSNALYKPLAESVDEDVTAPIEPEPQFKGTMFSPLKTYEVTAPPPLPEEDEESSEEDEDELPTPRAHEQAPEMPSLSSYGTLSIDNSNYDVLMSALKSFQPTGNQGKNEHDRLAKVLADEGDDDEDLPLPDIPREPSFEQDEEIHVPTPAFYKKPTNNFNGGIPDAPDFS